jgi:hypothetical protein
MVTETELKVGAATMTVAFLVSLGYIFLGASDLTNSTHYCEYNKNIAKCLTLSNTKVTCYTGIDNTGGKRCTTGWKELVVEDIRTDCELVIAYTDNGRYMCNGVGDNAYCVDNSLNQYKFCDIE